MPDTPAIRVGIKAKDHIVRINNESTVNMTLNEAVERLRGDVDTTVDVYVERDNTPGVKKFTITRAFIRPPAIDPPARVLTAPSGPGQPVTKIGWPLRISVKWNIPLLPRTLRKQPERGARSGLP